MSGSVAMAGSTLMKTVLPRVFGSLLAAFLPDKLAKGLDATVAAWVKGLPGDLSNTDPNSILYGLRFGVKADEAVEEMACWMEVLEKMQQKAIPSADTWYRGLVCRWELAQKSISSIGRAAIFSATNEVIEPLLRKLAAEL